MSEDWKADWQPLIDAIGTDFAPEVREHGADPVEYGTIRRWLEQLEFDCPLHTDPDVARAHGHADVTAPLASVTMFALPPLWRAGAPPIFVEAGRDAQPDTPSLRGVDTGLGPATTGFFETNMEIEALREVTRGERLSRRGYRLLACEPKETRVGRGAFMTWESQLCTAEGETVALQRITTYSYVPQEA